MSISLKTHKLLWGRSGNRCAFSDCRHELIADETETDDESIIGDEAHIVARSADGPRGEATLPTEERDKYSNLILLCRIHHKIIDDQPSSYTVEKLLEIKESHEKWIKSSLNNDRELEKDGLFYAGIIDDLFQKYSLDNWKAWTSHLLSSGQPSIPYSILKQLEAIPGFTASRFWPGRYPSLENSFFNMKNILNDLMNIFSMYTDDNHISNEGQETEILIWTRKFYHIREWNPEKYHSLLNDFHYHVALVEDLTLELTRAANLCIELVRKFISPKFREEEGKLLIESGPYMDGRWRTFKLEYSAELKSSPKPYPGLKQFMTDRSQRDLYMGEGYKSSYFHPEF